MEPPKEKKELVKAYLDRRQAERRTGERAPLDDIEKIRRELGWDLAERRQEARRGK